MAGERSVLGYLQEIDEASFDADRPMSALHTLLLRNNMQHLIDVACQTRYNWVASTAETGLGTITLPDETELDRSRSQVVIPITCTITDPKRYPSWHIMIASLCTGVCTGGTIRARMREQRTLVEVAPLTAITVSATTATWYSQVLTTDKSWAGRGEFVTHHDVSISGSVQTVQTALVNLSLEINAFPISAGVGDLTICGVMVREYLAA